MKSLLLLPVALFVAGLSACAATSNSETAPAGQPTGPCDATAVQKHIGRSFNSELAKQLQTEANAAVLRTGAENGPVTMDYNPARLNVFYDDKMVIKVINCG